MYKLQWAFIKDADGNNISPDNFVYHDTVFEYEDWDDAEINRIDLMKEAKDKYIRIVEV